MGSRRQAERARLEIYFRGAPVSEAHRRGAFVQVLLQNDDPTSSEVGLGLGFMAHLGRGLDHALESKTLSRDGVRLALSLPLARD
jgi:hypothetical protein